MVIVLALHSKMSQDRISISSEAPGSPGAKVMSGEIGNETNEVNKFSKSNRGFGDFAHLINGSSSSSSNDSEILNCSSDSESSDRDVRDTDESDEENQVIGDLLWTKQPGPGSSSRPAKKRRLNENLETTTSVAGVAPTPKRASKPLSSLPVVINSNSDSRKFSESEESPRSARPASAQIKASNKKPPLPNGWRIIRNTSSKA